MKTLSLVVPVFNSPDLARAVLAHLDELKRAAAASDFTLVETIFVDDGSAEPLVLEAAPEVVVLRNEVNLGKGFSVRRGACAAKGAWVLMSDVDLSAPLGEFTKLAPYYEAWIVSGSRYGRPGMPLRRKFLSWLFHQSVRLAGVKDIHDTQCGFKLFRMDKMRAVFDVQRTARFSFDVELIRRVQRAGGSVVEVPVEWQGGVRSSLRLFPDAPRMLWDLLKITLEK